ncbi:MAG: hypothetical protein SPH70_07675 [Candidatus Cryptobacteroides sp.]|nr:hypothetical protein [Bacteroidales bacterium]MDY6158937.1 hypothetical protein [Candidatus Cryptobacteroides sp.]
MNDGRTAGWAASWAACTLGLWGSCLDAGLAMHCCFPRCCGSPHCCGTLGLWGTAVSLTAIVSLAAAVATRFSGTAFGLRPALAKSRRSGHAGTQMQRGDTLPDSA